MIDKKRHRLSLEILGDLLIALAAAAFLWCVLTFVSMYIADGFLLMQNSELSDIDYAHLTSWIFNLGIILSVLLFVILFLLLLGQRLAYIKKIMAGIEALRTDADHTVDVEGKNELSDLAHAVNYVSEQQKRVRAEEAALQKEKEELIRSLSHDIRTPLTSILSYSELLTEKDDLSEEDCREYLSLIRKKGAQIKELTDILLDGGKRSLEHFDDARLLIFQLADEFESELENEFEVKAQVDCPAFAAKLDVRELQRIFDNLISNIKKYADRTAPVMLSVSIAGSALVVEQENKAAQSPSAVESNGIGLQSIRCIAGFYGGRAEVSKEKDRFKIKIVLTDIL